MLLILISIVLAATIGYVLFIHGTENDSFASFFFGVVILVIAGFAVASYAFRGYDWFASEYKAKLINREFNTQYTQAEVFWAHDVIDEIRQLDRKRIEINGDILRDTAVSK